MLANDISLEGNSGDCSFSFKQEAGAADDIEQHEFHCNRGSMAMLAEFRSTPQIDCGAPTRDRGVGLSPSLG